jgi:hypothetical protein
MAQLVTTAVLWSVVLSVLDGIAGGACAQGTTSAAIAGRILDNQGRGLQGVEVVVRNHATGSSMRGVSRAEGRYLVSGLEVGGPYSVTVRQIGAPMQTRTGLFLSLGQQLQVDVTFEQHPVRLQGIETQATRDRVFSRAHMGTERSCRIQ